MWDLFLQNAGMIYWAVVLGAWIVAYYETFWHDSSGSLIVFSGQPSERGVEGEQELDVGAVSAGGRLPINWDWMRQGAKIAGALTLVHLIVILILYCVPDLSWGVWVCSPALLCCLAVTGLWTSGRAEENWQNWPVAGGRWSARRKWLTAMAILVAGTVLSVVLLYLVKVEAGEFLQDFSYESGLDSGYGFVAFWMIINAPWIEEITFRHYLLPRLCRLFGDREWSLILAVVVTSAVFAFGHAAHTIPAWPKLVQTFLWGIALGWMRIWMGSGWAIGTHLGWNVVGIVVAFVMDAGLE